MVVDMASLTTEEKRRFAPSAPVRAKPVTAPRQARVAGAGVSAGAIGVRAGSLIAGSVVEGWISTMVILVGVGVLCVCVCSAVEIGRAHV